MMHIWSKMFFIYNNITMITVTQFFDLITRRRRKEGLIDKLCCCSAQSSTNQPTKTKYTKEREKKNTKLNQPTNAKYKDIKKENTKNINSAATMLTHP